MIINVIQRLAYDCTSKLHWKENKTFNLQPREAGKNGSMFTPVAGVYESLQHSPVVTYYSALEVDAFILGC